MCADIAQRMNHLPALALTVCKCEGYIHTPLSHSLSLLVCVDVEENCKSQKDLGLCAILPDEMKRVCNKTCKFCGGKTELY